MSCKAYRREIEEVELHGRLSDATRAHIDACLSCRTFHSERIALRQLVGDCRMVSTPPDFEFRLRARLAADRQAEKRHAIRIGFTPGALSIALAACFTLTATVAFFMTQVPHTRTGPTPSGENIERMALERMLGPQAGSGTSADSTEQETVVGHQTQTESSSASTAFRRPSAARATRLEEDGLTNVGVSAESESFGVGSASVTSLAPDAQRAADEVMSIPVHAAARPVNVLLHDARGAARVVSIDPVTFGARELVGQAAGDARRDTPRGGQGIW